MDWKKTWDEFSQTWQGVVFSPEEFFSRWDPREKWEKVVVFNLICGLIGGLLTAAFTFLFRSGAVIRYPLLVLTGTFVGGIFLFVCFKLLGGKGTMEETIKMVGYTQAVRAFYVGIPFVGLLMSTLASVYQIWLLVEGGKAVHRLDTGKAAFAVLLPVAVMGLLSFLGAVLIGVSLVGSWMHLSGG